jgi:hypothetical protein
LHELKARYETEEAEHMQLLEKLRSDLSQFPANVRSGNLENSKEKHETELTDERRSTVDNFAQEIINLRNEIESLRSLSVEFKAGKQELRKLQTVLSAHQGTDTTSRSNFLPIPPSFTKICLKLKPKAIANLSHPHNLPPHKSLFSKIPASPNFPCALTPSNPTMIHLFAKSKFPRICQTLCQNFPRYIRVFKKNWLKLKFRK